jgi:hypothetical protein
LDVPKKSIPKNVRHSKLTKFSPLRNNHASITPWTTDVSLLFIKERKFRKKKKKSVFVTHGALKKFVLNILLILANNNNKHLAIRS